MYVHSPHSTPLHPTPPHAEWKFKYPSFPFGQTSKSLLGYEAQSTCLACRTYYSWDPLFISGKEKKNESFSTLDTIKFNSLPTALSFFFFSRYVVTQIHESRKTTCPHLPQVGQLRQRILNGWSLSGGF